MSRKAKPLTQPGRRLVVLGLLGLGALVLIARVFELQVTQREFLQRVGTELAQRVVPMPAHRGMITDRLGSPLAVSSPVSSVWADPRVLSVDDPRVSALATVLDLRAAKLRSTLRRHGDKGFVYLKRRVEPEVAAEVRALMIKGVGLQREFRRFYPAGSATGQLLGFTNIDDRGQEGIELGFNDFLAGVPGERLVRRDRRGRVVDSLGVIKAPEPGGDLQLSIDRRVQYLAHRALRQAVLKHRAKGGSAVVLDVRNGEVLAMVNQPDFDPNKGPRKPSLYRNRAVTDAFEPGSTFKTFIVATAVEGGDITPDTPIDTRPGLIKVGRKTIRDHHNYGLIDTTTVLTKSSNVGAVRIGLSLDRTLLHTTLSRLGFGSGSGLGLPGETRGRLRDARSWRELDRATLAFGYGISTNLLQLAGAYAVIAADGVRYPPSLRVVDGRPDGERIFSSKTAAQIRDMLETVVLPGGTATRARVPGYRVAGKTGTVRKAGPGGYDSKRYQSLFVGMAPLDKPRLVVAVMVDEPGGKDYYGGLVAAPAAAQMLTDALRLLDVAPDDVDTLDRYVALWGRP